MKCFMDFVIKRDLKYLIKRKKKHETYCIFLSVSTVSNFKYAIKIKNEKKKLYIYIFNYYVTYIQIFNLVNNGEIAYSSNTGQIVITLYIRGDESSK